MTRRFDSFLKSLQTTKIKTALRNPASEPYAAFLILDRCDDERKRGRYEMVQLVISNFYMDDITQASVGYTHTNLSQKFYFRPWCAAMLPAVTGVLKYFSCSRQKNIKAYKKQWESISHVLRALTYFPDITDCCKLPPQVMKS